MDKAKNYLEMSDNDLFNRLLGDYDKLDYKLRCAIDFKLFCELKIKLITEKEILIRMDFSNTVEKNISDYELKKEMKKFEINDDSNMIMPIGMLNNENDYFKYLQGFKREGKSFSAKSQADLILLLDESVGCEKVKIAYCELNELEKDLLDRFEK